MPDISADVLTANVLIVDDEGADRRLMTAILEGAGYSQVTSTGDPANARALHRENRYDLIILDLMMPGTDGFAVMRELREVERDGYLPVLAVTSDTDLMARALGEGARDFIGKPLIRIEVLARVRNMLRERTLMNRLRERSRESETNFRALVEQSIAGIYMVDEGRFVYVNPRMGEILGRAPEQLLGLETMKLVVDEDRERLRENRRRGEAGDAAALVATYRMWHKDGRVLHLAVEGKLVTRDGRRVLLGIAQDVTERVAAIDALRHDNAQRQKAQAALELANLRLKVLSDRMLDVQENERRRIARELHDDVGQSLLALNIGLHRLQGTIEDENARILEQCIGVAESIHGKVRELAIDLRPPHLEQLGLADALRWLVGRHSDITGVAIRIRCAWPHAVDLPPDIETACYRICQEALANATRHAQAHTIGVELTVEGGRLTLAVRDDGVGFDRNAKSGAGQGGLGLITMEERAELAGGRLQITTEVDAGTCVKATFPLPARAVRALA